MRCKLLLAAKNQIIMEDFFYNTSEEMECQSTSTIKADIFSHVKYFQPDMFLYCINGENRENQAKMADIIDKMEVRGIPVAIFGHKGECDNLIKGVRSRISLIFVAPITVSAMEAEILGFLEKKRQQIIEENKKKHMEEVEMELPKKKHILVVDDDARILKLIKAYLGEKYDVATAISGKVALKFLENKTTDMILLDYEMPEENGAEVLEKVRSNPKTQNLPVVFLTGINDGKKIQKVLSMKPQGYLLKPVERQKIFEAVRNVIGE